MSGKVLLVLIGLTLLSVALFLIQDETIGEFLRRV